MKTLCSALLALGCLGAPSHAQFWPSVTTTTNMGTWFTYNISNLTNGVGLSSQTLAATHSGLWQEMWLSNAITTGWLQFDLGSVQSIATIAVWNYNSSISTGRGVALMDVSTSQDGVSFTPLSQEAPPRGTTLALPAHQINANGVFARYIKFDILQNYSNNYTGLSEVQFVVNPCAGRIASAGTGCRDSGGTPNTLTYQGCPDQGTTLTLQLHTSTGATGPLFLVFGLSDQNWNGILLPLDLGIFGATGCSNYVSHTMTLPAPPPISGLSTFPMTMPVGNYLIGSTAHVQFFHLDIGLNPLHLATSDYLSVTLG